MVLQRGLRATLCNRFEERLPFWQRIQRLLQMAVAYRRWHIGLGFGVRQRARLRVQVRQVVDQQLVVLLVWFLLLQAIVRSGLSRRRKARCGAAARNRHDAADGSGLGVTSVEILGAK